jgi:hypothetical protein
LQTLTGDEEYIILIYGGIYMRDKISSTKPRLMVLAFVFIFAFPSYLSATPVVLDMDVLPNNAPENWMKWDWDGVGNASVSGGILTINTSSCFEYLLYPRLTDTGWKYDDIWNNTVSNERGWMIETRMKVDPSTQSNLSYNGTWNIHLWIHDHTYLTVLDIEKYKISIMYPDWNVDYAMDTTNAFHTYRIEGKGEMFKVFVDGNLAIDYHRSWIGGGSEVLAFGDGSIAGCSKSYWDYFTYDTYQERSSVPGPPTIFLLGAGLFGLSCTKSKLTRRGCPRKGKH